MEDIFKKIFITDSDKRIKFNEIRQHPVFSKHFPEASMESQMLYDNKFTSILLTKSRLINSINDSHPSNMKGITKKKTLIL